jgi:probable phosphomutase (TIGR03848 family)
MSTVLLVRHGLTAMTGPVLAGRTKGLHLDERGRVQAEAVAARLAVLPLVSVVTSPLDRCADTARAVTAAQKAAGRAPVTKTDRRLIECDYGDWTGAKITSLAKDPMWRVVQSAPSAAVFPGGEQLAAVSTRAVAAIRSLDASYSATYGEDCLWVACSHGDVIKAILADALGMHLDLFQRIVVDPCSVSIVRYTGGRPFVIATNDTGSDLARLIPAKPAKPKSSKTKSSKPNSGKTNSRGTRVVADDATIGGGAGAGGV